MILQGEEIDRNNINNNNNKSYTDPNNLVYENNNNNQIKSNSSDKKDIFDRLIGSQDVPFDTIWPIVLKKINKRIKFQEKINERKRKRKKQALIAPFLDQLNSAGNSGRKIRKRVLTEPFKLLAFAENRRPPFYGLSRSSRTVKPRKPFSKDKKIEYENDSDCSYDTPKDCEDDQGNHGDDDDGDGADLYEEDDMIVFTKGDEMREKRRKNKAGQSLQILGFYHKLGDVRPEDRKIIEKCCVLLCSDEKFPISISTNPMHQLNNNNNNKSQDVHSKQTDSQDKVSSTRVDNLTTVTAPRRNSSKENSSFSLLDAGVDAAMVDLTDCDKT